MAATTRIQAYWRNPEPDRQYKSGVSLHSHTQHSQETLALLPKYLGPLPLLRRTLGKSFDYHRAFWTPPLTPRQAHRLEEKQIQRKLHLPGLVSLTDHDNIQAGVVLHLLDRFRGAPISTEWTVPFGPTFFHLGVHNLPADDAEAIATRLSHYTAAPSAGELAACLGMLSELRDVLVVLNHPLWDEKEIGMAAHRQALRDLLCAHAPRLHALEINGLRHWAENTEILALGDAFDLPVVAGGDRHGREPNAVLNLSCATTMAGFIEELRRDKVSHIVLMPQYQLSLALRTTRMVVDALREYPQRVHARRTWRERVFFQPTPESEPVAMTSFLTSRNTPPIFHLVDAAMRCSRVSWMRYAIRRALPSSARG